LVDERAADEQKGSWEAAVVKEGAFMVGTWTFRMLTACAVSLSAVLMAQVQAAEPPYVLVLRSRTAAVTPERTKDAQTGGGFIQVTQVQPNAIMALMRGAVTAGGSHKEDSAAMQFFLNQDFEVRATRAGLRPPRLVFTGWIIGALQSTLRDGGMAEHGPACAAVRSGSEPLLSLCLKPHGVGGSENLLVNDRVGPLEMVVAPGGFNLNQTFAIRAAEGKSCYHIGGAAANFDPDPKLDSKWNDVLKPFRAVPSQDFGFRVILRVVEDIPPLEASSPTGPLPPPQTLPPPREEKGGRPVPDEGKVGEANGLDSKK
jgi:hypothetical protein